MPTRTLLDMTQGILEKLDSDEVNSINDTVEATQVAGIIRDCFYDITVELDLPAHRNVFALEGLADLTKPSTMRLPSNVAKLLSIKYDLRVLSGDPKRYGPVSYLEPTEFVDYCNTRDSTDTTNNLVTIPSTSVSLIVSKLAMPSFWTTFDDEYVWFDSYLASLDSTLQAAKTICEGYLNQSFTMSDSFVPELPENLFPLLYNTAMAHAFVMQKQTVNPKAERMENRLRVRAMRNKWRTKRATYSGPDYGRH